MTTTVINVKAAPEGWASDPAFTYIGRAGRGHTGYFGNPVRLLDERDRDNAVTAFARYATSRFLRDPEYRTRVMALKGQTLVCFCAPRRCHGDILARLAEEGTTPKKEKTSVSKTEAIIESFPEAKRPTDIRLAVVGSRDFMDFSTIHRALSRFNDVYGIDLLVSGGAQGADRIGEGWAKRNKVTTLIHLAMWQEGPQTRTRRDGQTYNPAAGIQRNTTIVADSNVVMAFMTDPLTSRGTRDTVDKAEAAGLPVFIYSGATHTWYRNDAAIAWVAAREAPAEPPKRAHMTYTPKNKGLKFTPAK